MQLVSTVVNLGPMATFVHIVHGPMSIPSGDGKGVDGEHAPDR